MHRVLGMTAILMLAMALLMTTAGAASSPEAAAWLEKMSAVHDRGPFSVDYSATLRSAAMGTPTTITMTGHITYGSERHMRMAFDMTMGMPAGGGSIDIGMLTVADGEIVWMSMDNPMLGG
ncbi:MAG: hypothetical protein R3344_06105, partial [Acidobacteriota bacterium]|nr:hypothetical protein [Acidobacteriota bacterium]